ncbi:hypothetical protein PR048_031055 [Dryococelus australis]|uniref:Uncharacterized protein n=1 Tax=Dryococelus australis TaxID=614101 RepID=A0ABQ9G8C0_9NEOP|nr:hypothetical protein PR048_031055 [Dryococelus australis]
MQLLPNARVGETEDPRENSPTNEHRLGTIPTYGNPGATPPGIEPGSLKWEAMPECKGGENPEKTSPTIDVVRHDSHLLKSGSNPAGNRSRFAMVGGEQSNHYTTATSKRLELILMFIRVRKQATFETAFANQRPGNLLFSRSPANRISSTACIRLCDNTDREDGRRTRSLLDVESNAEYQLISEVVRAADENSSRTINNDTKTWSSGTRARSDHAGEDFVSSIVFILNARRAYPSSWDINSQTSLPLVALAAIRRSTGSSFLSKITPEIQSAGSQKRTSHVISNSRRHAFVSRRALLGLSLCPLHTTSLTRTGRVKGSCAKLRACNYMEPIGAQQRREVVRNYICKLFTLNEKQLRSELVVTSSIAELVLVK